MALCLIFRGEDIVSRTWLGGNILDHKSEPTYLSWKQDSFQSAGIVFPGTVVRPPHGFRVRNGQRH